MSKESTIPVTDEESVGAPAHHEADAEAPETGIGAQAASTAPGQAPGEAEAEAEAEAEGAMDPAAETEAVSPEVARLGDEILRLRAEMENLRRRSAREVENARKFGVERLVGELLPVKDSMELGLKAASEPGIELQRVRDGLELTLKQLASALEKFGLEEVDPVGQPFDPEFHEAMTMQPSAECAPNSVLEVFQKGYVLSGRLVRPAMVVVARAPEDA